MTLNEKANQEHILKEIKSVHISYQNLVNRF